MKELCFSGIQPTNNVHIGNYIGAIKQWVAIQHRYPCLFCVVDLHAITVPQDPKILRQNNLRAAATYLACGLDPKRSKVFIQSEVPEHTELAWILSTVVKISELERMTQFKDKAKKRGENVGVGLFTYPVLMAADILLYDTTDVPVGDDQVQHVELTRTIARQFNNQFGDTFVIPKSLIQEFGARIMGLDDPTGKMSKSAISPLNYISLTDTNEDIVKKIKKDVTDSDGKFEYDPITRPAISNLMTIFHHANGINVKEIQEKYEGKGYGEFKQDLAEAVISMIAPIRTKIEEYMNDPAELGHILDVGRDAAAELAQEKMKIVRERVGLGR
jgi:tryptophanyl-tRNA synthetase